MTSHPALSIVYVDSLQGDLLRKKTTPITPDELDVGRKIGQQLLHTAKSLPAPPAGLAAPQIGITRSVFIFSWDRKPEHLQVVINPSYQSANSEKVIGWEGCLSAMDVKKVAQIARYETIIAQYQTSDGTNVKFKLTGFAAKVFQHECDHLEGIVCVEKADSQIKQFETSDELIAFITKIKAQDAERYIEPTALA